MKKKLKPWLRYLRNFILILIFILIVFPYVLPLSHPEEATYPYANSHQLFIDETYIHYRVYEAATEIPLGKVLLVHGLGGSTFSYEKNAPVFAEAGYHVITVDLPGFGYSSRKLDENHNQRHRSKLLWTLLEEVDKKITSDMTTDMPWHLGGHSMGGGTVAAMAYENPVSTASVIFIDGALFETSRSNTLTTLPIISRWLQIALEYVLIKPKRIESFLTSAYGQPPSSEDIDGYLNPLSVSGTARSATALLKTAQNMPKDNLSQLDMPVLALWGENDSWVPVSDTQRIKATIPKTDIKIIKNAGHCPMETHPEEFNQLFLDWLSTVN